MKSKRIFALLLAAVLFLTGGICVPAAAEATESTLDGELFLTVSAIDFSVVGESEDIYLGMIPRELVTWTSEDPNVVSVENGVLTARGIGSTVIHASYVDREISCKAGCLAKNQAALQAMSEEVLGKPKRLPPAVDMNEAITFYDQSLIIGDSITYFMFEHEQKYHYLGNLQFVTRQGTSLAGFVYHNKNLYYQGAQVYVDDLIGTYERDHGTNRVYFLIGAIDIQVPAQLEGYFYYWEQLLERIHEKAPNTEIAIISNIPKNNNYQYPKEFNQNVKANNVKLKQFCADNGCLFLDLYSYAQDHLDRMPAVYSMDEFHLNEAGCVAWMQLLRFWAKYEQAGGTMIPS